MEGEVNLKGIKVEYNASYSADTTASETYEFFSKAHIAF
jgi:hypothetical protein